MTRTMTITGKRLAAMCDNGMDVYVTPGAEDRPYWASGPQWRDDYCVMTVEAILDQISEEVGYDVDIDDLRADSSEYEVNV